MIQPEYRPLLIWGGVGVAALIVGSLVLQIVAGDFDRQVRDNARLYQSYQQWYLSPPAQALPADQVTNRAQQAEQASYDLWRDVTAQIVFPGTARQNLFRNLSQVNLDEVISHDSLARLATDMRRRVEQQLDSQGIDLQTNLPFVDTKSFSNEDASERQLQFFQWVCVALSLEVFSQHDIQSVESIQLTTQGLLDSPDGQLRIISSEFRILTDFAAFVSLQQALREHQAGLMVRGVSIQPLEQSRSSSLSGQATADMFEVSLTIGLAVNKHPSYNWTPAPLRRANAQVVFRSETRQQDNSRVRGGTRGSRR